MGQLRICTQLFESLQPGDFKPFPQIWSSDAWHSVDPAAGYRRAAELLVPGGLLICTWRFPVLTEPDLQRVSTGCTPGSARTSFAQVAMLSTGQRAELAVGIRDVAGADGQAMISLTIWQYTVASRPTTR